ncbi:MAG: hypothetical protein IJP54_02290 [Synergistaceae bacterium]|nr:hypothetical protein [Synergistaceae bacterium]
MTPNQMLAMVRKLINDEQATGFTTGGNLEEPEGTQELQTYLDRAVDEYSKRQAAAQDMRLLKTMTVSSGATLPDDYLAMCGAVPVSITGKTITFYGDESIMPVRYFARLPYVTSYADTAKLPYERDQELAICALAVIYALNKHEYNVSQDLILAGYGGQNASQ